jgi:hypothetical protein
MSLVEKGIQHDSLLYQRQLINYRNGLAFPQVKYLESNCNLEELVVVEREKFEKDPRRNGEKDPRGNGENQQQTQLTYDAMSGN